MQADYLITTKESACSMILTLLAAHHKVFEEVGGDAFFWRQKRSDVDRQKLEHLALATKLGRESSSGDTLLAGVDSLMRHNCKLILIGYVCLIKDL